MILERIFMLRLLRVCACLHVIAMGGAACAAGPQITKVVQNSLVGILIPSVADSDDTTALCEQQEPDPSGPGNGSRSPFRRVSGVIVAGGKYVLSVADVFPAEVNSAAVFFQDGTCVSVPGASMDLDRRLNIAILSIEHASARPGLELALSSPALGEPVFAFGYTRLMGTIVTSGIVSTTVTGDANKVGVVQSNVAASPVMNGGPLINERSGIVGINSILNFNLPEPNPFTLAIPAREISLALQRAESRPGRIGFTFQEIGPEGKVRALEIVSIAKTGAAARAGLREGDVLVAINAEPISSPGQLIGVLSRHRAGSKLQVAIKRKDQELNVPVLLN